MPRISIALLISGTILLAVCIVFGRFALGFACGVWLTVDVLERLVPPHMLLPLEHVMRERLCNFFQNIFGPPAR